MTSSITYSVPNPYVKGQIEERPIEDWREGWDPLGKLVNDGLPVIRIHKPGSAMYTLVRPYHLINAQNDYVVDPDTQIKVIAFVSPLFNWKTMVREDGNKLDPIHKEPLSTADSGLQ